VLGESFGSPDELKAAIEAFANEWNLLLAHPEYSEPIRPPNPK